jgi:anaphase-promoting complex subunit 3
MDDEPIAAGAAPLAPSGSEPITAQGSTIAQAAQEAYEMELADYVIYDLMRMYASATRALAMYECKTCLHELERLPRPQQRSAWVMAMVGKAHYELGDYAAVSAVVEWLPSSALTPVLPGGACL